MKQKITALVPIRHTSRRCPGKNIRPFCGKPLFYWILETLAGCRSITTIVVDTDSPVVKKQAPAISNRIVVHDRPSDLCSDLISMDQIIMHDIDNFEADIYLQTHVTNPLLKTETIRSALETFGEVQKEGYDSLFSVTALYGRLWDREGLPLNHDPQNLLRTQAFLSQCKTG